jgi:hypothetical protein
MAVRPVLKLNLSSILFASSAADGKSSIAIGDVVGVQAPTGAVKLTIIDSALSLGSTAFAIGLVKAGDTVNIPYTAAATGANRFVSCVIEDGSGAVLFYGKLVDCNGGNVDGTADFTVPAANDLPDGSYTVKLFSEEINGNNLTDFSSTPISLSMTVDNH